ncbi:hypothetical protein ACFWMJ_01505 [Streptomyces hawaiiensis]|uniref:hypothetical protein n=1 Tax=Streptomyces hawaiiensis TaxID=67305 RepID=UPI00365FC316
MSRWEAQETGKSGQYAALPDRADDVRHEQVLEVELGRDDRVGHAGGYGTWAMAVPDSESGVTA